MASYGCLMLTDLNRIDLNVGDAFYGRIAQQLDQRRLSDAARIVSDRLGVPRSRVYDIGIALRQAADTAADEPDDLQR
ncbi:hypothetical protein HC762_00355 [bacterium]|nr:hypothetical protein [bacterium]